MSNYHYSLFLDTKFTHPAGRSQSILPAMTDFLCAYYNPFLKGPISIDDFTDFVIRIYNTG
jgi:hypothetical protein